MCIINLMKHQLLSPTMGTRLPQHTYILRSIADWHGPLTGHIIMYCLNIEDNLSFHLAYLTVCHSQLTLSLISYATL